MITLQCLHCGKEFQEWPSVIKNGNGKFCSIPCSREYKKTSFFLNCPVCNKKFFIRPSYIKRKKYCSNKCRFKVFDERKDVRLKERHKKDKSTEGIVSVYSIVDSNNYPIYIGIAMEGRETSRLHEHKSRGICSSFPNISMKILERVQRVDWREREKYWINLFLSKNFKLLNKRNGGGGELPPYKRIEKKCKTCGKPFQVVPSKENYGRGIYCSKVCMFEKIYPTRPCEHCGNPIVLNFKTRKRRFCSYRCSGLSRKFWQYRKKQSLSLVA